MISLAFGIGAAATILSLSDALLFELTAGVRNASELVDIARANQGSGFDNMPHPTYRYLREHSRTTEIAAVDFGDGPMSLGTEGERAHSMEPSLPRRDDRSIYRVTG